MAHSEYIHALVVDIDGVFRSAHTSGIARKDGLEDPGFIRSLVLSRPLLTANPT